MTLPKCHHGWRQTQEEQAQDKMNQKYVICEIVLSLLSNPNNVNALAQMQELFRDHHVDLLNEGQVLSQYETEKAILFSKLSELVHRILLTVHQTDNEQQKGKAMELVEVQVVKFQQVHKQLLHRYCARAERMVNRSKQEQTPAGNSAGGGAMQTESEVWKFSII